MRLIRATLALATLAVLSPATLFAQDRITIPADTKLADVLLTVYETEILDNIAAALIVAGGNFDDPRVVVMLLISTIVGLLVLLPAARMFAWRVAASRESTTPRGNAAVPVEAAR